MAYQALYRKWRPRTFSDVIGQEAITSTLRNSIRINKISHAFLLPVPVVLVRLVVPKFWLRP